MNITKLIDDLKGSRLYAERNECEGEFPLSRAGLFDGLGDFPMDKSSKSQPTSFLPYLDYMYPYAS